MESTTQIYLEIKPEKGDATGEAISGGYEGRIDITSFAFGIGAKPSTVKGSQKSDVAGNLDYDKISITKVFDDASLRLAGLLRDQRRFAEAKIAVDQQYVEAGVDKFRNEVLIIYLYRGNVADFNVRTSEGQKGASIIETLSLTYQKICIDYYAYDSDSSSGKLGDDYRLGYAPRFEAEVEEQTG